MRKLVLPIVMCALWALLPPRAAAELVYEQPHAQNGTLYASSWVTPDGSDYDQWVWDGFTLGSDQDLTEVRWRGGYDPNYFGSGGPVVDFTIEFYRSISGGSQPDIGYGPLVQYDVGGNAGETDAGNFGGVEMYDYKFKLPKAFHAKGDMKYWVQIEAAQNGTPPDWGIAQGNNGDGHYFRCIAYVGDKYFQIVSGDAAFSLYNAVATGACCFADGSCQVVSASKCTSAGGTYQSDGTTCNPNPCPQPPTGACCFSDGSCRILTAADCASASGTYQGDGAACDPNPCPPPDPCLGVARGDSNGDGSVDFNDIDCFVAALIGESQWLGCGTGLTSAQFACANDINQDGSIDFNDIDGFVVCLVNGTCP